MMPKSIVLSALILAAMAGAAPLLAANPPKAKPPKANPAATAKPAPTAEPASAPGQADDAAAPTDSTLEVTSDIDLEWLQQEHAYVARGNAVAKRGTVTVTGDTLIAYYRNKVDPTKPAAPPPPANGKPVKSGVDTGNTEIWRVVAEGNAHISSEGRDAYGDRLEYDKDKAVVVVTGKALKATTPTETVTARDSLEYWQDSGMGVARGDAVVTKINGDSLAGDLIGAHFVKDAQGHNILKTIESKGHVVITTATDIVHGDEGTYDLESRRTVVFGNVQATHGESTIEGESGEVNMDTGISQVFPGKGQRVRGLFVQQKGPVVPNHPVVPAPPPAAPGAAHP
jgi:lipopolysaccharide export system protein LptA